MRTPPSALAMSQAQPVHLDSAPGRLALKHVEPTRRLALEAHATWQINRLPKLHQEFPLRLSELPRHEQSKIYSSASVNADVSCSGETHLQCRIHRLVEVSNLLAPSRSVVELPIVPPKTLLERHLHRGIHHVRQPSRNPCHCIEVLNALAPRLLPPLREKQPMQLLTHERHRCQVPCVQSPVTKTH